ncbi:MAG TPA: putative Fe-S cluster assembly protein SufT [Myxococcales bacterium]|nr:putative Fe-S cluster assembly protein SufT [Myxococcales bacterium]HIN86183.1 putative Fe-S cluster assembly protein SufT [Myxococcales bacterium]
MQRGESITLGREVQAILIPDGVEITLEEKSEVVLTQSLGGTFTVMTDRGFLARISGKDSDALGLEVPEPITPISPPEEGGDSLKNQIWDAMRTCYDPEIPVNIVELGLIYTCEIKALPGGDQSSVTIAMTLTAPGCGMGDILKMDVEQKVADLDGVSEVMVDMVFDPPWNPELMSEATRLDLGLL